MRLLEELRTYLVSQGLVRLPRVAGSTPPMWLEPKDGVPAPGEGPSTGSTTEVGADIVVGAFLIPGPPPRPYESFQRQDVVEVWLRTRTATLAHDFERDLRAALIDKRAWQMAGMQIIETELQRQMQLLISDAQAFTFNMQFWFQRYA